MSMDMVDKDPWKLEIRHDRSLKHNLAIKTSPRAIIRNLKHDRWPCSIQSFEVPCDSSCSLLLSLGRVQKLPGPISCPVLSHRHDSLNFGYENRGIP